MIRYSDEKKFGDDVPSFTIGKKRDTKLSAELGPGTYNPNSADGQVFYRHYEAFILGKQPYDFQQDGSDVTGGPGSYDNHQ